MRELGIIHTRLDERLIHGQVATMWLGSLGATHVMIVDDQIVKDEIGKAALKAAVPCGIKLSILKTDTAVSRILNGSYTEQKVVIICKNIKTFLKMVDLGLPIRQLNLGNSCQKEGTIQVTKSVFLTPTEIERLEQLEKQGVEITAQMVPMEEPKPFSQLYRK